jgi:hypothetical protein
VALSFTLRGKGADGLSLKLVVTRYGRRQAVILSPEAYDSLLPEEEVDLSALERELDRRVARMQTPEHREAVEALFRMSGDEVGEAAVRDGGAARRLGRRGCST